MKSRSIIIATVLIVVAVLCACWVVPKYSAKKKYDELCASMDNPAFQAHTMGDSEAQFIAEVMGSWKVHIEEYPDVAVRDISRITGFSQDVGGLVDLYTYEFPPYSFTDDRENVRAAEITATLSVTVPVSLDQTIYYRDGLAYMKLKKDVVQVYEDKDLGVRSAVYYKPTK